MKRQQKKPERRFLSLGLSPRVRRVSLISLSIAAGLFVIANVVLWGMYRTRTYPNTRLLGATIGNTSYSQLSQKVSDLQLLPKSVELIHDDKKVRVTLDDLGIYKEVARTTASANQQRSWLPVFNLLKSPRLKAPIAIDSKKFDAKSKELAGQFYKEARNARLVLDGTTVSITKEQSGYTLDQSTLQEAIFDSLDYNATRITPPTKQTIARVKTSDLKEGKQSLEQQVNTVITYRYNNKTKQTTPADTAKWLVASGETYVVSNDAVKAYVAQVGSGFGIRIKDLDQVVTNSAAAVANKKAADITLAVQIASKTYSYCTSAKGVDSSNLPGLRTRLQSTYADNRGWSLGGRIEFKEATTGCDFTVWLTAADQMPSFGAICDSMWSCRVGPNVVINFDRWEGASPAWNANGGTLEEYRHMVINHETGHWLGFGHAQCPGPGLQAPVMQQQSINLQGCSFNAWPTGGEQATLRSRLGL